MKYKDAVAIRQERAGAPIMQQDQVRVALPSRIPPAIRAFRDRRRGSGPGNAPSKRVSWGVGYARRVAFSGSKNETAVTKADIVARIADATGLTKLETEAVLDGFIVTIIEAMKAQDPIELRGFGSFRVQHRPSRTARNPRTGAEIEVDERFVPVFKVSRELARDVDEAIKRSHGQP